MARARERDEDFRRFVQAHWLGLVRSAYLLVGDHGAAEDLVQQTLAGVYPHWTRRVREGAAVAYVRRAMVNTAISNARRRRVRETLLSGWAGGDPARGVAPVPDPPDPYQTVDDRDVVVRALRELPPRMRAVIVLRFVDDLTEVATADLLGMSVGSVKSQTSRGLQRLRAAMEDGAAAGRTCHPRFTTPTAAAGAERSAS